MHVKRQRDAWYMEDIQPMVAILIIIQGREKSVWGFIRDLECALDMEAEAKFA